MQINVIGSFFGSDGYSAHTRNLANALDNLKDIEICMVANKPADFLRFVNDEELKMFKRNPNDGDINLCISTPPNWELYMCDNKPFVGFVVWEGNKVPVGWLPILIDKRVNQVWVPSEHTKQSILSAIRDYSNINIRNLELINELIDKIKIVPHGVDLNLFYPRKEENKNKLLTFFASKGWRNIEDRGGNQYAVQAFLEEFSAEDECELLIKVNPSYSIGNIKEMLEQLKPKDKTDFAPINISVENIPYKDMNKFYQMADVFIAPTRCEAFHLGCIEAMACGLPVITTSFGGQTDVVNDKNGWILKEGKLEEVKWDMQYEGVSWWTPDISELRKVMRECYNDWKHNNSKVIKEKSQEALKTASEFTWNNSAKKAYEFLKELKI